MIVNYDNIRSVRPIAENMIDEKRLLPYIKEAITLLIIPAIGAKLYREIYEYFILNDKSKPYFDLLLSGGYYDNNNSYFEGLNAAIGYLSYSRFVRNQNVNNTAFGLTIKRGELSEPADDKTIVRIANDAEKIGYEYLNTCIEYLKFTGLLDCTKKRVKHIKINVIGD